MAAQPWWLSHRGAATHHHGGGGGSVVEEEEGEGEWGRPWRHPRRRQLSRDGAPGKRAESRSAAAPLLAVVRGGEELGFFLFGFITFLFLWIYFLSLFLVMKERKKEDGSMTMGILAAYKDTKWPNISSKRYDKVRVQPLEEQLCFLVPSLFFLCS